MVLTAFFDNHIKKHVFLKIHQLCLIWMTQEWNKLEKT